MPELQDKEKLKIVVDMLYISPQKFETLEATECEIEIREKLEGFKKWSIKLLNEKLK